jgi:hypothetical protein
MYAQQSSIDPSLAALLQTAQMVTPDQTPTVAAQVAQAAAQKMQPQGIAQGMPQARQDFQAAMPSMMRNMQQQQMQQMVQQAMQPKPAGIEGLPSNIRMAEGGVVGYAGPDGSSVEVDESQLSVSERLKRDLRRLYEGIETGYMKRAGATPEQIAQKLGRESPAAAPEVALQAMQTEAAFATPRIDQPIVARVPAPAPQAPAPRPPAQRPPAPAPAAPTGVAALAQPKMDLSRYEKAGAEDRAAIEKIIAAQEANAREKAGYMAGRPKFEQEGIAALTKANQAREELLSKERADDAYNRQQALLDQIGRRNINAYSQEQGRQRQRDLAAAEAQRLYEQAVIKQREAEFLQGAGRFEEAKKALDDKEKILSAMQTRINQSRQTEAGIAERQFTGDVQMFEGALNREQNERFERIRKATANQPGETERIFAEYTRRKAVDPKDAEAYLANIERIKGLGRGMDLKETSVELRALKDEQQDQLERLKSAMTDSQRKPILDALDRIAQRRRELMGAPTAAPTGGVVTPKSQAEFNALPKGARYINPADGKEYIKN